MGWARDDSAFTRAFEDLVWWEAVASSKNTAAYRHGVSWRAVNGICVRVGTEALDRVDVLAGPIAFIAIDEVDTRWVTSMWEQTAVTDRDRAARTELTGR